VSLVSAVIPAGWPVSLMSSVQGQLSRVGQVDHAPLIICCAVIFCSCFSTVATLLLCPRREAGPLACVDEMKHFVSFKCNFGYRCCSWQCQWFQQFAFLHYDVGHVSSAVIWSHVFSSSVNAGYSYKTGCSYFLPPAEYR